MPKRLSFHRPLSWRRISLVQPSSRRHIFVRHPGHSLSNCTRPFRFWSRWCSSYALAIFTSRIVQPIYHNALRNSYNPEKFITYYARATSVAAYSTRFSNNATGKHFPMQELMEYLRTVCGSIHVTKGDFDVIQAPEDKVCSLVCQT